MNNLIFRSISNKICFHQELFSENLVTKHVHNLCWSARSLYLIIAFFILLESTIIFDIGMRDRNKNC